MYERFSGLFFFFFFMLHANYKLINQAIIKSEQLQIGFKQHRND